MAGALGVGPGVSPAALASFPDVSAGLLASAVQKAILSAKEAAGMTDPKDALGGLGRVRVRAQHDYQPEKAMGARYTQLMTGEELMVTDIRHPEWWEGYRETSKDNAVVLANTPSRSPRLSALLQPHLHSLHHK